jgi:hypothetical protein
VPPAELKILEDASIQLKHLLEPLPLEERRGLLAADATRAKGDQWDRLQLHRKTRDRSGKLPKCADMRHHGILERAKADFVVVARVEQGNRTPLVEPLLERARVQAGRGCARRVDAFHSECDDLLLDLHQHSVERGDL